MQARPLVCAPLHMDNETDDFVVPPVDYEKGLAKKWELNDSFRMMFFNKASWSPKN